MAKQRMTFEGKNVEDWFKLPFVLGVMKDSNKQPFIALGDNPNGKMQFIVVGDSVEYEGSNFKIIPHYENNKM